MKLVIFQSLLLVRLGPRKGPQQPTASSVMKQPKIGVNESYPQLVASFNHNLVGSRARWGSDELYSTLNKDRGKWKDQRTENQNPPEKELAAPVLHPHPMILSVEQRLPLPKAIHGGVPHGSSQFSPQLRNETVALETIGLVLILLNSLINFYPLFIPNQQTEQWLDGLTIHVRPVTTRNILPRMCYSSQQCRAETSLSSPHKIQTKIPGCGRHFLGVTLTSWPLHDLTRLALSTLSLKGKNASELRETAVSLAIHCFFSASVNCAGTSSNIACHFTRSSSCENNKSQLSPKARVSDDGIP